MADQTGKTGGAGMGDQFKAEAKRPIPRALMIAAALGWILFFVAIIWRQADVRDYRLRLADAETRTATEVSALEAELGERIALVETERDDLSARLVTTEETVGTIDSLQARLSEGEAQVVALEAEVEQATLRRDAAQAESDEIAATLEAQRTALAETSAALDEAAAERDAAREALVTIQADRDEAEAQVARANEELVDIGARIEQARAAEAPLRETIAALTNDAAVLAEQTAEAEAAVQALREEEARLTDDISTLEERLASLEDQRVALAADVAALEERREALTEDVSDLESVRGTYQSQVQTLTETLTQRSEALTAVEERIAALQSQGAALALPDDGRGAEASAGGSDGEPTQAADESTEETTGEADAPADADGASAGDAAEDFAGSYVADGVSAVFDAEGTFRMETERGRSAEGRYTVSADALRLEEATGDVRGAEFPMICDLEAQEDGFALSAQDGSCRYLDGLVFQRAAD